MTSKERKEKVKKTEGMTSIQSLSNDEYYDNSKRQGGQPVLLTVA